MSFKYDLTQLKTREQLINFIGLSEVFFDDVLAFNPCACVSECMSGDDASVLAIPVFFQHKIPKKNRQRGYRIVWEPAYLKSYYKALSRRLDNFFRCKLHKYPHPRAFGYIGGRNIRENARDHCGHRNLISIDLKEFFPSITAIRVSKLFQATGINTQVADLLSRFITIEGTLPLGLPTSPTIVNAVCLPLDVDLDELANKYNATFSRYADDISFSSDGALPSLDELTISVHSHGFEIAESKTRKSKLGQAHFVTGLSISDSAQPHVPRMKKRRLRQELYYAKKFGLSDHFHHLGIDDEEIVQHEINRLDGLVKFTAYHEPQISTVLKVGWAEILQKDGSSPSFKPKNQSDAPFCIFVDEAEFSLDNSGHALALGMAVSQHQDRVNKGTEDVLEATLSDIWAAGDRSSIQKRGIHFSDATQDIRLAYVEMMRTLPFEGYVAFARLPNSNMYELTYLRLLNAMIKRRLMAAESQFARLVFEQNAKVRQELIREVVTNAHKSLKKSNNRRPERFAVDFVGKPNLGMSVPDFLLGVLGKYLSSTLQDEGVPMARDVLLFERIRDKYRLILDVDNRIEYSRRNPILPLR